MIVVFLLCGGLCQNYKKIIILQCFQAYFFILIFNFFYLLEE